MSVSADALLMKRLVAGYLLMDSLSEATSTWIEAGQLLKETDPSSRHGGRCSSVKSLLIAMSSKRRSFKL